MNVTVIGGGLAGVEAAWQLKNRGIDVTLFEMKPKTFSKAHKNNDLCELVCSNSLKSNKLASSGGMLKKEMEILNSICIEAAYKTSVPAGGALAVDRDKFSRYITEKIENEPKIKVIREEIDKIPKGRVIIASGPLSSQKLLTEIKNLTSSNNLYFFDAAAPIVTKSSIDFNETFYGSRYDKDNSDYLNCPMDKNEYEIFYNELIKAKQVKLHDFENLKLFEGCMPIEQMAKRGIDTMRYGPLKPIGLIDSRTNKKHYAVLQLRKENKEGTLFNLVGFQTNLTFKEQKRVFSLFKALRNAEFVRYGVMHKNAFINSPKLLDDLFLKSNHDIMFAGQITGVEGYMESASCGIIAGINLARDILNKEKLNLPNTSMIGALMNHLKNEDTNNFQPMGANMGIIPPLEERVKNKEIRYSLLAKRGLDDLINRLKEYGELI